MLQCHQCHFDINQDQLHSNFILNNGLSIYMHHHLYNFILKLAIVNFYYTKEQKIVLLHQLRLLGLDLIVTTRY